MSDAAEYVAGVFGVLFIAALLFMFGYGVGETDALHAEASRRCSPDRLLIRDVDSAVCAQADGGVVRR